MASFTKFNSFVQDLGRKVHNLHTDVLKVLLTNSAPLAANTVKANLTEIGAGNGYSAGGTSIATGQDYTQVSGSGKLQATDIVFTASGGSIGPFRYAVLYNSTATNSELIGWWDYSASITLLTGETLTVDFDGTNGIFAIS